MTVEPRPRRRRLAMILSGGGARGAYEVGVLWYVFDELTRLRGAAPKVDVLSGTSVGAINACFLAAHLLDPMLGLRRLVELWSEIEITRVLGFGLRQVVGLPRIALGGGATAAGLFDVRPMAELVQREISWRAVARSLRKRQLHALSVSTTEVSTGRTVVFMHTAPDVELPPPPPRTHFRPDHIGPEHALASAAIPLLFPAVRIDDELYLDGGLRQNTPIAPALRLGATHVFVTGSSREVRGSVAREAMGGARATAPGAAFLLGKVLNAFLLDHVDVDLELLNRLNHVLADGTELFGADFVDKMSGQAMRRAGVPYRYVRSCVVRPSEDIGALASEHVRRGRYRGDPILTKRLLHLLDLGAGAEADLASYLLFDGTFCRQLIELGRADARARRDELLAFFADVDGGDEGRPLDDGSGTWERGSMMPFGT